MSKGTKPEHLVATLAGTRTGPVVGPGDLAENVGNERGDTVESPTMNSPSLEPYSAGFVSKSSPDYLPLRTVSRGVSATELNSPHSASWTSCSTWSTRIPLNS